MGLKPTLLKELSISQLKSKADLVAIASMLVPVHHKLQGWIKEKPAQRTMKV